MSAFEGGSERVSADEILHADGMSVSYEVPGYASIHYHPRPELKKKSKYDVFIQGMEMLRKQLAALPEDRRPTHVAATSWLVKENPRFFTEHSFTLVENYDSHDMQELRRVYQERVARGMVVPEEFRAIVPHVALLPVADFLENKGLRKNKQTRQL